MSLSHLSPKEVDTKLSELYTQQMDTERWVYSIREGLKKIKAGRQFAYGRSVEDREKELAEATDKLVGILDAQVPYAEEYSRRRWSRFFLVTSSIGHVHSSMRCSTTYMSTEWAWLPELSGKSESEAVKQHGEKMCTVCFPSAPAHPAWKKAVAKREEEEKAKQDALCGGSGYYPTDTANRGRKYVRCMVCGETVSRTPNGNLRSHQPPSEYEVKKREIEKTCREMDDQHRWDEADKYRRQAMKEIKHLKPAPKKLG